MKYNTDEIIERLETIKAYAQLGINTIQNDLRGFNVEHNNNNLLHAVTMLIKVASDLNKEGDILINYIEKTDKEELLDAYNDYIEAEFQERRCTKLETKLGLMYSTDDFGNDVEMYYDTEDQTFYGWTDGELTFELKADYDKATKIIDNNSFDDYYNAVVEGDKLC